MNTRKETAIKVKCPAKLNLFLDVLEKRSDGYHEIETIFERIDLCDEIEMNTTPDGIIKIFCSNPLVPLDSSNLCYKAAQLLQQDFMVPDGVEITINKNIPVASGLGGGSSDAAGVLNGLNQIWGLGLKRDQILHYAAKVGSDVSFFIEDRKFSLGRGKGEVLKDLNGIRKELFHILVVPQEQLFAKDIYTNLSLDLTKKERDINILALALKSEEGKRINDSLFNALEETVEKSCKTISKVKQKLVDLGVRRPMVSGSGPAVFGLIDSRKEAENIKESIDKIGLWPSFVVTTF